MGHKNNNIINETIEHLKSMQAFGTSKHLDKQNNCTQDKIYSFSTFQAYKEKCLDFMNYARKEFKCKSIEQAKPYVKDFLSSKIASNYSPWTIKLYACALGKLYQVPSNSFIELPTRKRYDIVRSRDIVVRDKHFSESKNSPLIDFCKSTGLRRSELEHIKGNCLIVHENQWYIKVENGKGGKYREVPILNNNPLTIDKMQNTPPHERVWGKVHSACDVHSYRSDYANALYNKFARPLEEIPKNERYYCRGDMKGQVYDKIAMQYVSKALGHERICVIAYSYLR